MTKYVIVTTADGDVRGSSVDGVTAFKGIPYAAPPVGANRLQPPQPATPWSGVRDAFTFGPKAPQLGYPPTIDALIPELVGSGDDCLTLNIWTPDDTTTTSPVMVWIPGGAFIAGTAATPWYDGSRFARDGIVCVTLNYRLGADGFLCLGAGNCNRGLLDQIAALEWVRQNIAAFGGDPGNVTIFGESAGAMSIGSLLAIPRAEGLFRRAILQSGAAHPVMSLATAERVAGELAAKLGVANTPAALASVPSDRMIEAQVALDTDLAAHPDARRWGEEVAVSLMSWQPVIDGLVLPAAPIERIASGASANVDVLIGTTTDEWRLFLVTSGAIDRITDDMLATAIVAYGLPLNAALDTYRSAHPHATAGDLLAAVQGDWYTRTPAIRLAETHAQNSTSSTYMFEFAWKSPQCDGRLGACHGADVPFVFDTLGCETESLWGSNPPQRLADRMHAVWTAFAATGRCDWPEYELTRRATMRFDVTSEVIDDPHADERRLWESVGQVLQPVS